MVVDQDGGPTLRVDWLNVVRFDFDDSHTVVTACCLLDGSPASPSRTDWLSAPEGWAFEGSISQRRSVHRADEHDEVVLIDHRDGVDVYRELATGREVYTGRTRPVSVDVAASKDWIEPHTTRWSPCATCAHMEGGSHACRAFPGGIPASILSADLAEKTTDPRDTCRTHSPRDGD